MDKIFFAILFALALVFSVGSYSNLDYVKENAEKTWNSVGYEVIGYEGYQWGGLGFGTPYGGAKVWHSLKRGDNGIIYSGYLQRWGDEIHVYGPKAVDAIKPE